MKSTNARDAYLRHLLASIKKKRQFSIENAHKTDLYSTEELLEFMKWFDELCRIVRISPPNGYVSNVLVTEDKAGNVVSVGYQFFNENEELVDSEIEITYLYTGKE